MNIDEYNKLAESLKPKNPYLKNAIMAFLFGGLIGMIGQGIYALYMDIFNMESESAAALMSVTIVFIASVLTGLGIYDKIAKYAGAGTFIPITGFANSMTSAALEAKSEGLVLGIGSNMFKLGGTVITFGIVSSVLLGVMRYVFLYVQSFF